MDLLDIRKKAKDKKADDDAAQKAAQAAGAGEGGQPVAGGPGGAEEAAPPPEPKEKKPRARRGKKAAPEPPREAAEPLVPGPDDAPAEGPDEGAALEEMFLALGDEGGDKAVSGPVSVGEVEAGPAPEQPVRERMSGKDGPPSREPADEGGPDDGHEDGEDAGDTLVEYLAFRLGKEEYAVKVEHVREIIRLQKITDVPRAPGFVKGIISLRGVIIPVFDIKKRLGFEDSEGTRATRIVVVSEDGMPQGMIVDKVTGVVRFPEKGIEPPPAVIGGVEAEYIHGVGRLGDRLLILFNTGRVLAMEG